MSKKKHTKAFYKRKSLFSEAATNNHSSNKVPQKTNVKYLNKKISDVPKNNTSIFNNHFEVTINDTTYANEDDGEKIMLKRTESSYMQEIKKKLLNLVYDSDISINKFRITAQKILDEFFKIPFIAVPSQDTAILLQKDTTLYRISHDDNLKFEFGRDSEAVTFPGRLNEVHQQSLYLSFKKRVAMNEAQGWISKSNSKNFYITQYRTKKDMNILSLNAADFQTYGTISNNDSKIALRLSKFKNSFLVMKAPDDELAEHKFYLLTNMIKNEKNSPMIIKVLFSFPLFSNQMT